MSVVKAYDATSDFVFVILDKKVDLPTLWMCQRNHSDQGSNAMLG